MKNPCNGPLFSKAFRAPKQVSKNILDKESVDELIYNTRSQRDRLIMELQARCGLRIGEVLKIKVSDISERKLLIREPKSGKEGEVAFMSEQVARRVDEYIRSKNLSADSRLFPISYSTARSMIIKLGSKLNLKVAPHDLRRYSATHASRNGIPLEIISKIILRHQDLKTTQVYLGKVSESEAIRWMDILHAK
ncbi:MAG TPA: site-specific integrase [Syntrophales bacterium]|jgi:integrase|nr:site-specific integrase [Syntrophales bacterium]